MFLCVLEILSTHKQIFRPQKQELLEKSFLGEDSPKILLYHLSPFTGN